MATYVSEQKNTIEGCRTICNILIYAHIYVFEWQEKIVGVGAISSFGGSKTESILLTIFVLPEHSGKGIGRGIIHTLE